MSVPIFVVALMQTRLDIAVLMRPIAFAAAQLNLALHDCAERVPGRIPPGELALPRD